MPASERISVLLTGTAARMAKQEQLARFVYILLLHHEALPGGDAALPAFIVALEALVS